MIWLSLSTFSVLKLHGQGTKGKSLCIVCKRRKELIIHLESCCVPIDCSQNIRRQCPLSPLGFLCIWWREVSGVHDQSGICCQGVQRKGELICPCMCVHTYIYIHTHTHTHTFTSVILCYYRYYLYMSTPVKTSPQEWWISLTLKKIRYELHLWHTCHALQFNVPHLTTTLIGSRHSPHQPRRGHETICTGLYWNWSTEDHQLCSKILRWRALGKPS